MEKLGTNYGGWIIPKNIALTPESIIYSVGVGEDISFDLLLYVCVYGTIKQHQRPNTSKKYN